MRAPPATRRLLYSLSAVYWRPEAGCFGGSPAGRQSILSDRKIAPLQICLASTFQELENSIWGGIWQQSAACNPLQKRMRECDLFLHQTAQTERCERHRAGLAVSKQLKR